MAGRSRKRKGLFNPRQSSSKNEPSKKKEDLKFFSGKKSYREYVFYGSDLIAKNYSGI
ncbi:MAG: hypothetical protein ACLFNN_02455 [Candidatus Paceibacterota bacterium]